ncbi:hypothetical protein KC332_g2860 [Hortaea werneckii]|uniref:AAA+ ATPase domain-containing protein n=1 Tax=Hortaea werneckii TaxID=91943 RepID=A0A3M7IUN4_HORWE|nr:hypothetical protein KC350_g5496 [Hortaea werneckii]KAI6846542.1 hypothetical protein KC358_g2787 [Hortaea werneckii]KAI6941677.1 hypothetical protein KC341_g2704 [Hortaea werneckii]KAI6946726.1 hypothetical protein KC348_g2947 [Hortaea werneckii]KAI6978897.1 hypothetical protein KC321_g2653 [Hortaea werneckii]
MSGTPSFETLRARYNAFFKPRDTTSRSGQSEEIRMSPLVSLKVKDCLEKRSSTPNASALLPQARLLGRSVDGHPPGISTEEPILYNVDAPNSTFLCGSQGSGKSYTLSCLLESCLIKDDQYGSLDNAVAGVVFNYDADLSNVTAETASLCSRGIKVRVLISPSNYVALEEAYSVLVGASDNLVVQPLLLGDADLNVSRMKRLMAFSDEEQNVPLYMEVMIEQLRKMATSQRPFTMAEFEKRKEAQDFKEGQASMLNMRLNLLKSFMNESHTSQKGLFKTEPGTLTIVDLTDPFLDPATVCLLLDICLALFKQNRPSSGLVIGLDEAHRYLNKSTAAEAFTESLVSTIRMQRHNATRVIIATQEPTISERLLDLCSISIVHHFNSPAWYTAIKGHLGGASALTTSQDEGKKMFETIVDLRAGESLVFSPSSYLREDKGQVMKLGSGFVKMQTRLREGVDAGRSEMASG